MFRYSELIKKSTNYANRMNRLSRRIFGEVVRPTNNKSMKVVQLFSEQPIHMRPEITQYYPRHVETHCLVRELRKYGLIRDEHEDFREEMKRLRALRGKAPPKKGEGKRAKKS